VICTAFTGIAASLLVGGGQTIHSKFKLPIPTELDSVSFVQMQSLYARSLRNADLIIIDEASMVSRPVLECIDRLCKDLTGQRNIPFGGKVVLLTGDFRQCLPVCDNIEAGIQLCLKNSDLWQRFDRMSLIQNMRADPDELEFKEWLMEIGEGRSRVYDQNFLIRLPDRIICDGNLVDEVFGRGEINIEDPNTIHNVILTPTNKDSLEINDVILNRVPGQVFEYLSTTRVLRRNTVPQAGQQQPRPQQQAQQNEENNLYDDDFPLNSAQDLTPSGYPPHRLRLKVGAIVILLKNWSLAEGLCNGTRLRVDNCYEHSIRCTILTGPQAGEQFTFCRTTFNPTYESDHVLLQRFQFPFRLAFSITINKSQGQTFNRVGLLLVRPVFSHGQLYVAASRVRNFNSLRVLVQEIERGADRQGRLAEFGDGVFSNNVVYRNVL
jgi:hypothetical protein